MKYVYILTDINYPENYYTGITSYLKRRLSEHNSINHKHSQQFQPWEIKCYFAFKNHKQAADFKQYLKTSSGRFFCKKHF
ncbi:GIY-YIG nuclease family protein [Endomicrobium proavitum]|uniref:GIY-YIG domain-containing protein n=1 Tax=Endomicrobium proavitum TaxID=1408281 RepID=A0A0G3WKZ3_9BACT|nr:GIY-YIG nuclease family protein [Endomicrobium proavitum]AKL98527.1 hypothetical protein Epro_1148 [Endomicrobium proavitum]